MWKSLTLASLLIGCAPQRPVAYAGHVQVTSSQLVSLTPEVKTVADADEPVFLVRGSYWLFHDGRWFKSSSIHGTWLAIAKPPVAVRQIDQPYAFTHYRKDHPADQTASREAETNPTSTTRAPVDAMNAPIDPTRARPKMPLMPSD